MTRTKTEKEFDSADDETISELHEITDNEYGDYHWLYEPQLSDKVLAIDENDEILAFCLYSLVDRKNIDRYSYADYKEVVGEDSLILNHIIVRSQHQGEGLGREIVDHIFEQYDKTILCKAWVPDGESTNRFFEEMGFTALKYCQKPWNHIEFKCLGCDSDEGCVCSGVVYAKDGCF